MNGQTEEKKNEYRLYAAPTTAEATEETEKQRFSRTTADYTLVYTAQAMPDGWLLLAEEDAGRLTPEDRRWLDDCNTALIAEDVARNKPRIVRKLADLLEAIEGRIEQREEGGETEYGEG